MNLILEHIDFMPAPRPQVAGRHAYYLDRYKKYMEDMILLVRSEINRVGCDIDTRGIISLELLFQKYRDQLVIIMRNDLIERSPKKGDLDNYEKAWLDILQYALSFNDKQIYNLASDWR